MKSIFKHKKFTQTLKNESHNNNNNFVTHKNILHNPDNIEKKNKQ